MIQHFLNLKVKELKLASIPSLAPGAIDPLMEYHWPGNVRELQNIIERELILNPTGPLTFVHLQKNIQDAPPVSRTDSEVSYNLDDTISNHIRQVLRLTKGKINGSNGAAALLGVNPSTLRNRMSKLGINYGRASK